MQVHSFVADSAADAVGQIRDQLGPDAVVVHVRPCPAPGISRLWQKPRIEVLACRPERATPVTSADPFSEIRQQLAELKQKLEYQAPAVRETVVPQRELASRSSGPRPVARGGGGWRVGALLEDAGLLPLCARRVVDHLVRTCGPSAPESVRDEVELTRRALREMWAPVQPPPSSKPETHVFVGAPGVGKTTCLCKWLAKAVLLENQNAGAWRLDGPVANTAECLSVYGEILRVPVERSWPTDTSQLKADTFFVDLPGVDWRAPARITEFLQELNRFPAAQVHLVLNAAYETPLLMNQIRAFSVLPISDLIVTHLDEEARWGKLWNLVVGTNFTIRFLSTGQNIPGDFEEPSADKMLAGFFPNERAASVGSVLGLAYGKARAKPISGTQ
jgi:flagellar biosynthesis protein FlhF